jgi:hypothetical protein
MQTAQHLYNLGNLLRQAAAEIDALHQLAADEAPAPESAPVPESASVQQAPAPESAPVQQAAAPAPAAIMSYDQFAAAAQEHLKAHKHLQNVPPGKSTSPIQDLLRHFNAPTPRDVPAEQYGAFLDHLRSMQ